MSDDAETPAVRKPGVPGLLKRLGIEVSDSFLFDPLPEEELWWWEQGDEPDPGAPP